MIKSRKLAYSALILAAVIWGAAPPIIKHTLNFVSPTTFLFYRFFLATIILIPIVIKNIKILSWQYILVGLIGTPINLWLLFEGIQRTSANEASVLAVLSPLFIIAGGVVFLQEKLKKNERIGLAIALVGILLTLIRPELNRSHLTGNLLVLAGSFTWAVFTLGAKKFKLEPSLLTATSFLMGVGVISPLTSDFYLPILAWPGLMYMTIGGSILAYWAYSYGVKHIEASEATLFTYLQPLIGLPLAVIFLHETPTPLFLVGTLIIAFGAAIAL